MAHNTDDELLAALQQKLDAARPKPHADASGQGKEVGDAMRTGAEVLAALLLPTALGLIADVQLNTLPVFFVLGFCLGCAAAIRNLQRNSKRLDNTD